MWVIFSTVIHEGGRLLLTAKLGSRHIIGFCGLLAHTLSCATTHPITPPFWAHKSGASCGVIRCRWKPMGEKCFGCAVQVLCC